MVGSPCCPRDSQESSPTPQFKSINSLALSFLYSPTLTSIDDYWKTIALTRWTFVNEVMSLLFNMPTRLVITFLPRSKRLLISKYMPAMQEAPFWFLGLEDLLEKGKSYHLPSRTSPWGRKVLDRTERLTTKKLWVFEKKMSMQHQWENYRGEKKESIW